MLFNKELSSFEERDLAVLNAWILENKSVGDIARQFGLEPQSVGKILKKNGVKRERRPSKKYADMRPISPIHAQIGFELNAYRSMRNKLSASQMALKLGMSRLRLRKLELGIDECTLTELLRISQLLGVSVEKLTTIRSKNDVKEA
jgi:plasmid maintenance system antidote protein VapI